MKIICDKFTTKVHRYKEDNIVLKDNFLYSVINGLPFLYPKEKNLNMTTRFVNDVKNALNNYDGKRILRSETAAIYVLATLSFVRESK